MKIIDGKGVELSAPNLSLGRLVPDRLLIAHHEAVEGIPEKWHYNVVREYPNGGKEVVRVIDVPGVAPKAAWDEYEEILRYIPYTDEELAEMEASRKPTLEEQVTELQEALELLLSEVTE